MLNLTFAGWFQCRLATNPDPTDEPRGVSGYTFALGDEPDLDRIIRLQDPVAPRTHAPTIDVAVREVRVNDDPIRDHVLVGAPVRLLDHARFESRNRVLSDDKAGTGPIHPFHLQIGGSETGATVRRLDVLDLDDPGRRLSDVSAELLNRRAPVHLDGFRLDDERLRVATGIEDPDVYRGRRRALLTADLKKEGSALAAAAIRKRVDELGGVDPYDHRMLMMRAIQTRRFDVRGPSSTTDIGFEVNDEAEWPLEFWMGGWDADGLCGFMQGTLQIPLL